MQAFEKVDSNFLLTELDKTLFIAEGYEENFMVGLILDKENVKTFNKYENLDTKKKWFKELLDNFYNTFVLFHNKFYEFFLDKENPYVNNGLKKEKLFMLNDFIMNYFTFIENMKLPILNNLQYFTMNINLESELLLAVQRLTEKIPNLKMTSIIYKGKLVHNQLPFSAISILYNIFFSAYECTNKYTKFNNPVLKQHFIENLENNNDSKNENNINKNDKKEEKKEEKKIETKEENKEEKKEEQKEETKDEIKEEKKEQNEIIIEKEKTEENDIKEENKEENEIKEENKTEGEKQENFEPSPYRKILNIKSVKNQFLTGVLIDPTEPNHYDIFIPKIYIKELDFEEYSMIIYLTQGILFFLFFDKDFIIENQIEHITKIPTRITKYFRAQFDNIIKLDRPNLDPNIFCYKNENNKCLKFSGFIKKNLNTFDWKLFESIQKAFFINGDTDMTSIAKIKGFYVYFMNNIGQEIVMLLKDNLTLTQLKQEIEKMKKNYFGNLFLN
jgi:flagellar biosynthesis GTPase FlhF